METLALRITALVLALIALAKIVYGKSQWQRGVKQRVKGNPVHAENLGGMMAGMALVDQFAGVGDLLRRQYSACARISRRGASRPSCRRGCVPDKALRRSAIEQPGAGCFSLRGFRKQSGFSKGIAGIAENVLADYKQRFLTILDVPLILAVNYGIQRASRRLSCRHEQPCRNDPSHQFVDFQGCIGFAQDRDSGTSKRVLSRRSPLSRHNSKLAENHGYGRRRWTRTVLLFRSQPAAFESLKRYVKSVDLSSSMVITLCSDGQPN